MTTDNEGERGVNKMGEYFPVFSVFRVFNQESRILLYEYMNNIQNSYLTHVALNNISSNIWGIRKGQLGFFGNIF